MRALLSFAGVVFVVLVVLALTSCGGHQVTYRPPQSSITPEGAKPAAPPGTSSAGPGGKHIDAAGDRLIEGFEGFSSCPYRDSVGTGHPETRGYGETEGITPSSRCISRAQGQANLQRLVETRYEWALRALGVPLNQHQWDALSSFVWNLGAGIFQGTTIGSELRAREYYAASSSMLAYDHAGGQVLSGLRTRREAEVRLFRTPAAPTPRPPPAPSLQHLIAYRTQLRVLLKRHDCRPPGHARPSSFHTRCGIWLREGAAVNRAIRAR